MDAAGDAYVSGSTSSVDFPVTPSAYETKHPTQYYSGFVTKLSPNGSSLVYSTYFDSGIYSRVALDSAGDAFLCAVVLAELSPDGKTVISSTSLDGAAVTLVAIDPSGDLVVGGGTTSTTFPGANPFQLLGTPAYPFQAKDCYFGGGQYSTCDHAVLAKLNPQGEVIWSSVLGSDGPPGGLGVDTEVNGLTVDSAGIIYAAIEGFGLIKVEPVGPAPLLVGAGVVSSAGFKAGIAPGGLVSIFGTGLTTAQGIVPASSFPLPATLEGTSVSMNGQPAPILAVADVNGQEQVNVQAPLGGFSSFYGCIVRRGRAMGFAFDVEGLNTWPSIFVGADGAPAVTHADYSLVTAANPAHAGETIVIWATGGGAVTPPIAAGAAAPASPLSWTVNTPVVTIGGQTVSVAFSGLAPGFAGLYQINVAVPAVPAGQVQVSVGTAISVTSTVTIAVQ